MLRQSTTTAPGSREYQDRLAKDLHTAGKFFRATNGGGPYNTDDCLLGIERLRMKKEAANMEKVKKVRQKQSEIVEEAKKIIEGGGPRLKADFVTCIKWKTKVNSVSGGVEIVKKNGQN